MVANRQKPMVLSVASGKGGVGKTVTSINLALSACRMGLKTLLLDGDLGMANVDIVLGLRSRYNIHDVMTNQQSLRSILLEGPFGLHIIPSGSGLAQLAELNLAQRIQLIEKIEEISGDYNVMVIDTGAGISHNVLHLNSVSDALMLVTTPEPHAMTDAYAFLKVMFERHQKKNFNVIVNQVISVDQGLKTYQKLADVTRRFLGIEIRLGGVVPKDTLVERSVLMQKFSDEGIFQTRSGQAWNEIMRRTLDVLKTRDTIEDGSFLSDLMFPSLVQSGLDAL